LRWLARQRRLADLGQRGRVRWCGGRGGALTNGTGGVAVPGVAGSAAAANGQVGALMVPTSTSTTLCACAAEAPTIRHSAMASAAACCWLRWIPARLVWSLDFQEKKEVFIFAKFVEYCEIRNIHKKAKFMPLGPSCSATGTHAETRLATTEKSSDFRQLAARARWCRRGALA